MTTSETSRAHYLGQAAVQYSKSGDVAKASQLVADIKTLLEKGADAEADLTRTLKLIAEQQKDEELQLVMLEHEVEDNPTDTQKRFALAYKYSETENQDMALYHYLKIPVPQRDPTTWNNIGVSYGDFRLPVKGVRAFKRAADAGETLAMSNLGNKLLNAGFFDEAKVECKKALAIQDYHKNVATLLNRLKEAPDEDETKLKEALEKVKGKADFLRDLGAKALLPTPQKIHSNWMAPEGKIEARLTDGALKIFGSYERPANSFAGILSGNLGIPMAPTSHKIEYTGQMRGKMFVGNVSRTGDGYGAAASLLSSMGTKTLMYLTEDETEFRVIENYQSQSPTFYVLKAVA